MINPINSNLYKQTSKKYLLNLLHIHDKRFLQQRYVSKHISPYIQTNPKPRLIEVPSEELKIIQRHIKNELNKIIVPENIFSGVKGKSYIENAKLHSGNKYVCAFCFFCICNGGLIREQQMHFVMHVRAFCISILFLQKTWYCTQNNMF